MLELPNKKYQIIYADPPWEYQDKATSGAVVNHYKTMTLQEICNLPVNKIADTNSVLFLWATFPLLEKAFEVIKSWGFEYKTVGFVWVKKYNTGNYCLGLGNWTRSNTELCLIAKKGNIKPVRKDISQLVITRRKEHSRKPDEIKNIIIDLMGDVSRIELFARNRFEGWDCWGDQLSSTIQKEIGGFCKYVDEVYLS